MALHVADYLIIRDEDNRGRARPADFEMPEQSGGSLRPAGSKTLKFILPRHAVVGTTADGESIGETGILAYVLDPVPFGGELDLEYEIVLNQPANGEGHVVRRERIRRAATRGVWGLVRGVWLLPNPADNVLEFRETEASEALGRTLRFSNVVLWFQREVAEP